MIKNSASFIMLGFVLLALPCHGAENDAQEKNTGATIAQDVQFPNGFHNGGIGACDGCHSKTNNSTASGSAASFRNSSGSTAQGQDTSRGMFNGQDPSSTCLLCHMAKKGQKQPWGYYVATDSEDLGGGIPPSQMTPGGDFGWLKKTYRWSSHEGSTLKDGLSPGDHHGHNIVAAQFGYNPDFSNIMAPGGSYPSEKLSCTSCHDPHGSYRRLAGGSFTTSMTVPITSSGSYKSSPNPDASHAVGAYRLLAGKGYSPKITDSSVTFTADPPAAVAPDIYNRAEPKLGDTRVAYGSGMSEWCENCHKPHNHPTGNTAKISPTVVKQYNSYVASGDMTGSKSTAFSSLVPFEIGSNDYAELKSLAGNGGKGADLSGLKAGDNVMCLTCHRAHASGWDAITRWNSKSELIVYNGKYPGIDNSAPAHVAQGRTSIETQKAYYDRPVEAFALYQRGLCSKCHAKD